MIAAGVLIATGEASVRAQTAPPAGNPPPGYAPPPGYYPPAPPPGYYPPPGYAPPGYYPPAPPPAFPPPGYVKAPPRPARRLFQLIPYIGAHSFQGDGGAILGPGLRVGSLVGFRVNEYLTINGELTIDILNASGLPMRGFYDSYSEENGTIGLSPLVAFPVGSGVELAFGPKIAFWGADYYQDSTTRGNGSGTYSGVDYGANGAVFAQVGRKLWVGGLAAFDLRTYGSSCFTPSYGGEVCTRTNLPSADKVVALSALLMFSP
jgi:hypothetical protein